MRRSGTAAGGRASARSGEGAVAAVVARMTARFVAQMLRLAREHLEDALVSFVPLGAGPARRPLPPAPAGARFGAEGDVDRLVALVERDPWPPQSRDLQRLLGVGKGPFLRLAALALATGRITRTGTKAGVRYHPAP